MRKSLRRAQTVTPFGVGAVYDVMGESLVAADAYLWEGRGERIREPRLERKLGVDHFRMAPAAPDDFAHRAHAVGIPFYRFPQWHFCRACRRMQQTSVYRETGRAPVCTRCGRSIPMTPMRFVMACPRGHLADVPWDLWAHQDRVGKCEAPDLRFETRPGGSGLDYVIVRCMTCGAQHTLAGIASRDSLRRLGVKCPGRQPWQRSTDADDCQAVPQVLQRGATNLTFPIVESSIDIPPHSRWDTFGTDRLAVLNSPYYPALATAVHNDQTELSRSLADLIAADTGLDPTYIRQVAEQEAHEDPSSSGQHSAVAAEDDLLGPEYEALLAPDESPDPRNTFIRRDVDLDSYLSTLPQGSGRSATLALAGTISRVVQVTRLREVRALRGFSRLGPATAGPSEDEEPGSFSVYGSGERITPALVPADLGRLPAGNRWLPAIEVYGEGIFVTLDEVALQAWEARPDVSDRIRGLAGRRDRTAWYLPKPTPRLVLLHTLSHLLIRQLSFECGYSIASLRERLYVRDSTEEGMPMSGILIYTAAGDSEGTMGGLVREGDADRLLPTIIHAILGAGWCSSDPVCRESSGQGPGSLNLAACHACALLPETSCILSNRLLDRLLVIDTIENPDRAFFAEVAQFASTSPV